MSGRQIHQSINLHLLKLMYLSREGDRREGVLLRQSKGWFQVAGMGHETLAVIAQLMSPEDFLFPYYRDRAMMLARGVTNFELALAYFAKRDSSSGGRQMPSHYSCREKHVWSVPTPTGANLLAGVWVGVGTAAGTPIGRRGGDDGGCGHYARVSSTRRYVLPWSDRYRSSLSWKTTDMGSVRTRTNSIHSSWESSTTIWA